MGRAPYSGQTWNDAKTPLQITIGHDLVLTKTIVLNNKVQVNPKVENVDLHIRLPKLVWWMFFL